VQFFLDIIPVTTAPVIYPTPGKGRSLIYTFYRKYIDIGDAQSLHSCVKYVMHHVISSGKDAKSICIY
jgi:hypothetical protein